jgi:hypothetical protein
MGPTTNIVHITDVEMEGNAEQLAELASLEEQSDYALTEEHVEQAREDCMTLRERLYGQVAINIAEDVGIFSEATPMVKQKEPAGIATYEQMLQYNAWATEIKHITRRDEPEPAVEGPTERDGDMTVPGTSFEYLPSVDSCQPATKRTLNTPGHLNREQVKAHSIVGNHLLAHLEGKKPPQLLMVVRGEGGTGKSTVINAITETFSELRASHLLGKTATSGVAASQISGSTVHSWGGIPVHLPSVEDWMTRPSKETEKTRLRNIGSACYLLLDEFLMLTKDMLTLLSQVRHLLEHQSECAM